MIFFYFYNKISYQFYRFRMNPTSSPFDERAWKDRNLLCACGVLVCRGALELYYIYHNKKEYEFNKKKHPRYMHMIRVCYDIYITF